MTKEELAVKIADTMALYLKLKRKWILEHGSTKASVMENTMIRTKYRIKNMIEEYIDLS